MHQMILPVATVSFLLAVAREVAGPVALEALFALAAEARVAAGVAAAVAPAAASAAGRAAGGALAGEVPGAVAFVAHARTHCWNSVKLLINIPFKYGIWC